MDPDLPTIPLARLEPQLGDLLWQPPDAAGHSEVYLVVPFEPFDSGLDYLPQPETPTLHLEGFSLPAAEPAAACGRTFDLRGTTQNGSIYVGRRHNPVSVQELFLEHVGGLLYDVRLLLYLDFEFEGVGQSVTHNLTVRVEHEPPADTNA